MFHPVASNLTMAEARHSRINAFGIQYRGKVRSLDVGIFLGRVRPLRFRLRGRASCGNRPEHPANPCEEPERLAEQETARSIWRPSQRGKGRLVFNEA